jgi:TPR repeat protein
MLGLASVAGQDSKPQPTDTASSKGIIRDILLSSDNEGLTIEVTTDSPDIPETARLQHPDRLVFDFPGVVLAGANRRIPVNNGPIVAVRASLFRSNPPMSRIVVDLKEPLQPELHSVVNKLLIRLRFGKAGAEPTPADSDRQSSPKSGGPSSPNSPTEQRATIPQTLLGAQSSEYELLSKARSLSLDDLKVLEDKATAGDAEAETILALAYHSAVLLKNDESAALRLLQRAANQGYVPAEESLGIFYATGIGMPQPNRGEALTWYRKAAQHGSVDAATNLATMYATADGVPLDMEAAITWFRKAGEAGGAAAQYNLALIYGRGDGVQRDDQKSLEWLVKAADQDVIPALLDLAYRYMHPQDGSKPDVPAGIQRYQRAAEVGDARAQALLGDIFSNGTLVPADYPQAVKWYRMAADQGQKDGQFGLAARYVLGQGVAIDSTEALRWFKAAADQGHADAQYDIGRMYEAGKGNTAPDLPLAVHYYELAAQQGVVKAQYCLGVLLTKGQGVQSDSVSAYKWLMLSQDSVHDSAVALNNLRKSMTPAEITDAEHQVDAWRIAHKASQGRPATP